MHPLQDAEFSSLLLLTTTTTTNVENWCNNCNSRNKTKLKEKIPHFFSEFLPKLSSLQDCRVAAAAVSKKKIAARDAENPSTYLHATNSTHCKQTHHKQRNQLCSLPSFLPSCRRNSADPAGVLLAEEGVEKLGATKASGRANGHVPCRDNACSLPPFQLHEEDDNAPHNGNDHHKARLVLHPAYVPTPLPTLLVGTCRTYSLWGSFAFASHHFFVAAHCPGLNCILDLCSLI